MVTHDSKIVIVGGGVFGLSTALWLARDGYQDITIFDRCDFNETLYDPANGSDGASSDINKVFRMAYGDQLRWVRSLIQGRTNILRSYQNLAIEVRPAWLEWNQQIARSPPAELPSGLEPDDKLLHECGNCYIAEGPDLHQHFKNSLETMEREAPEYRKTQFLKVCDHLPLGTRQLTSGRMIPSRRNVFARLVQNGSKSFMSLISQTTGTRMVSSIFKVA